MITLPVFLLLLKQGALCAISENSSRTNTNSTLNNNIPVAAKELRAENAKLKNMLAELLLMHYVIAKKLYQNPQIHMSKFSS